MTMGCPGPVGRAAGHGFVLIDACVGLVLVCVLLAGLHELRSFQLKTLRRARTRLCAAEIAHGFALLASLDPDAVRDSSARKALFDKLDPSRALARPEPLFEAKPLSANVVRLRCGVRYVLSGHTLVQEVDAIAPPSPIER